MMTSASTFPQRLTKIDDLTRSDHHYLTSDDKCFFLGEYTARRGFAFSPTNQLILNFKKKMDRRGLPEWRFKGRAIQQASEAFRAALSGDACRRVTFVPVPPSKAKGDPLYDDRMVRMLEGIWPEQATDIREIVLQSNSTAAVHDHDERPTPTELISRYHIDTSLCGPTHEIIAITDDVLTTGCHYVAVRDKLREIFPETPIIGLFLARRVPESSDFELFDDIK